MLHASFLCTFHLIPADSYLPRKSFMNRGSIFMGEGKSRFQGNLGISTEAFLTCLETLAFCSTFTVGQYTALESYVHRVTFFSFCFGYRTDC